MTETTLERMARAAWLKVQEQVPEKVRLTDWSLVPDDAKKNFTDFLRAGLMEARTPSHEITAAVVKPGDDRSKAVLDFRAMIDAILAEKT